MTGVMTRMSSSEEPASQLFRASWLHGRVEMRWLEILGCAGPHRMLQQTASSSVDAPVDTAVLLTLRGIGTQNYTARE